jgi:hypothetical protein
MARDLVYDRYYMEGFTLAEEDYDGDENRWKGVDPVIDDEVDVDDLAAQYIASDRSAAAAAAIVQKAVTDYMAKVARSNNVEKVFQKQLGPDVPDRYQPSSFAAWKTGYEVGLYGKIFKAALDRWAELLGEDEEETDADQPPARQNPGGAEPLSYWTSQGTWDAQHGFDMGELDEWVDLDERAAELEERLEAERVRAVAGKAVADYLDQIDEDGHEDEWVEQNKAELDDMKHLPSEAYKHWRQGYKAWAVPLVEREIERRARDAMDPR